MLSSGLVTLDEAVKDHDQNLDAVLRRCAARGIKLNSSKVRLRRQEVPFIGHVTTDKGRPHQSAMPRPTDVAGGQRLLGMIQYLAKFLPNLSDITKPLRERELTHKEAKWVWDQPQENAFRKLQEAVTSTPVLRYYNLAEEVTIQCDASQTGLGAARARAIGIVPKVRPNWDFPSQYCVPECNVSFAHWVAVITQTRVVVLSLLAPTTPSLSPSSLPLVSKSFIRWTLYQAANSYLE